MSKKNIDILMESFEYKLKNEKEEELKNNSENIKRFSRLLSHKSDGLGEKLIKNILNNKTFKNYDFFKNLFSKSNPTSKKEKRIKPN